MANVDHHHEEHHKEHHHKGHHHKNVPNTTECTVSVHIHVRGKVNNTLRDYILLEVVPVRLSLPEKFNGDTIDNMLKPVIEKKINNHRETFRPKDLNETDTYKCENFITYVTQILIKEKEKDKPYDYCINKYELVM